MKKLFLIILSAFLLTGCSLKKDNLENATIYTTIYPVKYLTEFMYKDYGTIESIYPSGADVFNYELTDKQIKKYAKSDLFIYNGLSNEKTIAKNLINKNKNLLIIDVSNGLSYKNGVKDGETIDYHNGFVISKSIYNNDILIGRESFDDNGILQHKLFADDNGEFNRYQSYYPDGAVKIDAEISGFEIAGKVKEYYNNGHVKSEYQIKNGALTGEYTTYRKNGNISYSEAYTAGETLNGEKKLQAAIVQMKLRFMYGIVKDILSEN